jgi:hypothetical protein
LKYRNAYNAILYPGWSGERIATFAGVLLGDGR